MQSSRFVSIAAGAILVLSAMTIVPGAVAAASIYDSGYTSKIRMTAGQKAKVKHISAAARAERRQIFAKYGISERAKPEISRLMKASGELQAMNRNERNQLAKVFTPTQLQQYDALVREVRERVVRAAK